MRTVIALSLALAVFFERPLTAQDATDQALVLFRDGGAYCFRAAPPGVAMLDEIEWTVLVLTSASNRNNTFRIRTVDPGRRSFSKAELSVAGLAVTSVWRSDATREAFFDRFAKAIAGKSLRARVVKTGPPNLARLKPGERAEAYLAFADRGTKVSFDKAPDLTAEAFLQYAEYIPD